MYKLQSKGANKPILNNGVSQFEKEAPYQSEDTFVTKSINYIKQNKLKVAIIAGATLIVLIIIIAICSSSSPEPEQPKIPKEELVDAIMEVFPKKETMTYDQFLDNLAKFAFLYDLDDDGKAWFAFVWISQHIKYSHDTPKDPRGVYNQGETVCHGYSRLFIAMVQAMGYPEENTHRIIGIVKLNNHCTLENFGTVHEWTALKVNGKWELFDARRGTGTGADDGFVFGFNPYYYNISPSALIRSHYPEEESIDFQLLDPIVTEQQFCDMAATYPNFFKFGFNKIDPDLYFINTTVSSGKVKYYFDPEKDVSFNAYLVFGGYRYNCDTITRKSNYYEVSYTLSEPGEWTLYFYGNNTANAKKFASMGYQIIEYKKKNLI